MTATATNYIGYPQLESLLKKIPALRIYLQMQQREYTRLYLESKETPERITKEEIYQTLSYGNRKLTDMPKCFPTNPDDKTLNIIEQADTLLETDDFSDDYLPMLKELQKEISLVGAVIDDIDDAFKILYEDEKTIISEKYWSNRPKTWAEVCYMIKIEQRRIKEMRNEAINKMLGLLKNKLTFDTYEYCLEKVTQTGSK